MHPSNNNGALIVTGSSGFVGSHAAIRFGGRKTVFIDRESPANGVPDKTEIVDLSMGEKLRLLSNVTGADRILHLAAEAEVVIPWRQIGDVVRSNEIGTYNLVSAFRPRLIVFASTSAVYGNAGPRESTPVLESAKPLGLYGASKLMGEIMLRDWAQEHGRSAVAFRLGNVVGPRCRGLIPYLVSHALKYPDGAVPARMRGYGKLFRDYIPVDHIVSLFAEALDQAWDAGTLTVFNAGTGRGMSNRDVANIVKDVLARRSLELNVVWEDPVAPGEAESVVLDVAQTVKRFGIPTPSEHQVRAAIEEGILSHLEGGA